MPAGRARLVDELTRKVVALGIGGSVYDLIDPVGRLLFNVLGTVANFGFEMRKDEGAAVAKARGSVRGKSPKSTAAQERHLVISAH